MMAYLGYALLVVYGLSLVAITVYCLMQLHLLYYYKKYAFKKQPKTPLNGNADHYPFVTVQLPIFNERFVVERLLDAVSKLDYPQNKLEIQVLDDSTDDTTSILRKKIEQLKTQGHQIELIHRTNRQGFKAGALKEGMQHVKGEFIAIFDADFIPRPNFLRHCVAQFQDPEVGVVQTKWEHINEDYSILTKLQAIQLDVHFSVEQAGRYYGDCLLQFNGTAGMWRKETIFDAGGWKADTLTEDLDLSYRAQLRGWKINYLEHLGSPAELPAEMHSLKSQQFRWTKGGAETARLLLPKIWSSDIPFMKKIHGSAHLLSSSIFVLVFISSVCSVPLVYLLGSIDFNFDVFVVFIVGILALISVYYVAHVENRDEGQSFGKAFLKFIFLFPVFLAMSMGLSFHNTLAVIQGYIGKKSPFVRTPKFNLDDLAKGLNDRRYFKGKLSWKTVFEGFLSIYFLYGFVSGLMNESYYFLLFHLLLFLGFGGICFYSFRHLKYR